MIEKIKFIITIKFIFYHYFICLIYMNGLESSYTTQCYYKLPNSSEEYEKDCITLYDREGCIDQDDVQIEFMNEEDIQISTTRLSTTSLLNVSVDVSVSGPLLTVVYGISSINGGKYCATVCFTYERYILQSSKTFTISNLELPHGKYNVTVLQFFNFSLDILPVTMDCWSRMYPLAFTAHKNFTLGGTDVNDQYVNSSNKVRRFNHMSEDYVEDHCSCKNCIQTFHTYDQEYGLLSFHYNLTKNINKCRNFTVRLLGAPTWLIFSEDMCQALNEDYNAGLSIAFVIATLKNVNESPVEFLDISTGCYLIRTLQGAYHDFFWVESEDMVYRWNISIHLIPRDFDSSIEVTWVTPVYPYNFTNWEVELWYSTQRKLKCFEENPDYIISRVFDPQVVIEENSCTFTNLSEGFYCAKLTPADKKCPQYLCTSRSSPTILLKAPPLRISPEDKKIQKDLWLLYLLPIVGAAVGVIGALIIFVFCRRNIKPRELYRAASMDNNDIGIVEVLVIWSKSSLLTTPNLEEVIQEFKNLLKTYSKCKVYDYLELFSLSWKERQSLLNNPVQWLYSYLNKGKVKVIFIASRTVSDTTLLESPSKDSSKELPQSLTDDDLNNEGPNSLDTLLYKHAIRYLRDPMKLSTEYSRIFFVRFPGLSAEENELENEIVPWMRFNIPYHFRNLTLKLRGLSDDSCAGFPELSDKAIKAFEEVVNNCRINTSFEKCP